MIPSTTSLTIIAVRGNGGGGFRFCPVCPFMPQDIGLYPITLPTFADQPADSTLQSLYDYATYLQKIVLEHECPVVLLGTGIGGAILLEYMQHYSSSIDGVILHAPVGARLERRRFPTFMNLPGMADLGRQLFAAKWARPIWKRLLFVNYDQIPMIEQPEIYAHEISALAKELASR